MKINAAPIEHTITLNSNEFMKLAQVINKHVYVDNESKGIGTISKLILEHAWAHGLIPVGRPAVGMNFSEPI